MDKNLKANCRKAVTELLKLVNHYCNQNLSVEYILFVKCYEIMASRKIKQFDSFQEYAQFKNNNTLSFDEMVREIQALINDNYHVSWIDFTLYYVSENTAYILLHVTADNHAVEPQYHVGIIRTLNENSRINDYVDNMDKRLMNKSNH